MKWAFSVAYLAWTAAAAIHEPFALMKRQNLSVGSPLYNCHDNCGEAILEVQNCGSTSINICNDTTFTTDYNNCLQCSGPDNEDIWKYYGSELNATAASCGFSTTPESGTQDDVSTAAEASNSTSDCEAAVSSATGTATGTSSSATSTSSSGADQVPTAGFAHYAAMALGAMFMMGL